MLFTKLLLRLVMILHRLYMELLLMLVMKLIMLDIKLILGLVMNLPLSLVGKKLLRLVI